MSDADPQQLFANALLLYVVLFAFGSFSAGLLVYWLLRKKP